MSCDSDLDEYSNEKSSLMTAKMKETGNAMIILTPGIVTEYECAPHTRDPVPKREE